MIDLMKSLTAPIPGGLAIATILSTTTKAHFLFIVYFPFKGRKIYNFLIYHDISSLGRTIASYFAIYFNIYLSLKQFTLHNKEKQNNEKVSVQIKNLRGF